MTTRPSTDREVLMWQASASWRCLAFEEVPARSEPAT